MEVFCEYKTEKFNEFIEYSNRKYLLIGNVFANYKGMNRREVVYHRKVLGSVYIR